jgi:hypothetical protein
MMPYQGSGAGQAIEVSLLPRLISARQHVLVSNITDKPPRRNAGRIYSRHAPHPPIHPLFALLHPRLVHFCRARARCAGVRRCAAAGGATRRGCLTRCRAAVHAQLPRAVVPQPTGPCRDDGSSRGRGEAPGGVCAVEDELGVGVGDERRGGFGASGGDAC